MGIFDKFMECFPSILFKLCEKTISETKLSVESVSSGEREILRMLNVEKRILSKVKKLHRNGKASSEEVFDHEWRVNEIQQQLDRFHETTDLDDLLDSETPD